MTEINWFISCPRGLEGLLARELEDLGGAGIRETVAGVYAAGDLEFVYRTCLWSRLANRVLKPLGRFAADSADELYRQVLALPWEEHLGPGHTLAVDFTGTSNWLRHTRFGAQRVKDAIADRIRDQSGSRPEVNLQNPDIRINARLAKGRVVVSLDMSGDSLHRRGYRVAMVAAPLKENLAAALLIRAEWPGIAERGGALIDPMCGSGTLLIEGAMMAADIAPGLNREQFGFHRWLGHEEATWRQIREDALERRERGLSGTLPEIRGYDKDRRAIDAATDNITAAGLDEVVRLTCKPLSALKKPTHKVIENGLLITNPPYGERWGEVEELSPLYQTLGEIARREFAGWRLAVFTGNADLAGELRLRPDKKYRLYNGTIPARLLCCSIRQPEERGSAEEEQPELSPGAQMLANRLRKNAARLKRWLQREQITCYRLYDSDIPEYAVAVDIYTDEDGAAAIHVQEYAAPSSVDETTARRHLREVKQALGEVFPGSENRTYFKERRRQKGREQYRRLREDRKTGATMVVREGRARLEVNLEDYLDTGLFLDHRPVRKLLAELAPGSRFLNLFCYTAAATVQAALAGASSSVSVDMSNTYLAWAGRNLALNDLDSATHKLERADCLEWLAADTGEYDLIFLDPPTFSNSKKMESVLDIQRDHPELIRLAMARLSADGYLVFSNNFRRFSMDEAVVGQYVVEEITARTLDPDFERNPRIHNCWLIRHR